MTLAIGVNDLRRRDDNAILENMAQIISAITKHTPLVVSAVLPLDERIETVGAGRNTRIAALNTRLAGLCDGYAECVFVDASPLLIDESGNLSTTYHVGDGVHPNTAGYAIWIEALRNALASLNTAAE